jgi:hypothetical protein
MVTVVTQLSILVVAPVGGTARRRRGHTPGANTDPATTIPVKITWKKVAARRGDI